MSRERTNKTSAQLREQLENESSAARKLISELFDDGTFAEIGAYIRKERTETDKIFGADYECEFEPVITGYGSVGGKLVYAFIQDESRIKGALTSAHAKKICDLMYAALKRGAPVVGVFASNGSVVTEGSAALSGYGQLIRAYSDCKGEIPLIAVIDGVCASTAAAAAGISDIVAVTGKGSLYVVPPFLMKSKNPGTKAGCAEFAAGTGAADLLYDDAAQAFSGIRDLISVLPSFSGDEAVDAPEDDLNRLTPEIAGMDPASLDIRDVIKAVADNGKYIEIGERYAPDMVAALAVIAGRTIGIVGNQPCAGGGRITPKGAEKASRIIDFCSSFDIPLLTLADTLGFDISENSEKEGFAQSLSALGYSYAVSSSSKVTAVIGPAYGGGYVLMGSKSIGADICIALDSAKIAPLAPDAAAEFLKGDKPADELKKLYDENIASPLCAARNGDIDEIVSTEELRQRIISAFEMLCD